MTTRLERLQWEEAVYTAIEEGIEVSRSDAQAIAEAQQEQLENAWTMGLTPSQAATEITNHS